MKDIKDDCRVFQNELNRGNPMPGFIKYSGAEVVGKVTIEITSSFLR